MVPITAQPDQHLVAITSCPQFVGATDGGLYHFRDDVVKRGRDDAYAYALQLNAARIDAITAAIQGGAA